MEWVQVDYFGWPKFPLFVPAVFVYLNFFDYVAMLVHVENGFGERESSDFQIKSARDDDEWADLREVYS